MASEAWLPDAAPVWIPACAGLTTDRNRTGRFCPPGLRNRVHAMHPKPTPLPARRDRDGRRLLRTRGRPTLKSTCAQEADPSCAAAGSQPRPFRRPALFDLEHLAEVG